MLKCKCFKTSRDLQDFITPLCREQFVTLTHSKYVYTVIYDDTSTTGLLPCPSCKHELADTFNFCPNCGQKLG